MNKSNSEGLRELISTYALYSEEQSLSDPELIHIEDIRARAELFDWTINVHVHPKMFQLVYVRRGQVRIHIDGHEQFAAGPCLITVPRSVVHGFEFPQEAPEGAVVTVSQLVVMEEEFQRKFPFIEEILKQARIITFDVSDPDCRFIEQMLDELKYEYQNNQVGKKVMFEWLLFSLLVKVGRKLKSDITAQDVGRRYEQRYKQLCDLIDKHYREHLSANRYAEMLNTTKMGLTRTCAAVSGKSVGELIQDRLVLEAQRFLIYTAAPASLIAYDLGFKDPAYFSRFFKRRVGMTPGQFRNQRDKE